MASSVRCGGGAGGTIRLKSDTSSSFLNARLPNLVPMKKFKSGSRPSISATVELSRVEATTKRDRDGCSRQIDHDTIHKWMPEAVVEIVKNLKQAPLLVQVYDKGDERSARLKMEKAVAEKWPKVKESWSGSGSGEAPEGVILVEELEEEEEDETNKAWGVVIQGRGCEYGPACYLLKTTRVRSGLGAACTHFCLTKVTSFRESAFSQFTNCWLV